MSDFARAPLIVSEPYGDAVRIAVPSDVVLRLRGAAAESFARMRRYRESAAAAAREGAELESLREDLRGREALLAHGRAFRTDDADAPLRRDLARQRAYFDATVASTHARRELNANAAAGARRAGRRLMRRANAAAAAAIAVEARTLVVEAAIGDEAPSAPLRLENRERAGVAEILRRIASCDNVVVHAFGAEGRYLRSAHLLAEQGPHET